MVEVTQVFALSSFYNHNTLTNLNESLQMHFKFAVRNFIEAGDSLTDVLRVVSGLYLITGLDSGLDYWTGVMDWIIESEFAHIT